ncbi:MAG TPA: large-conductance mechanosensitive channel protein MscL [Verrucomicrobiales bacterium]|nr:large-conductance mechanosensitive channel protein MscL [Verrucomicrobiales bacterium]
MKMLEDFKKFAMRGNLVELAIGFTVGAAFSTVAKSLVTDIIMPPTGLLLGGVDFADLYVVLREGSEAAAPYATLQQAQAAGAVTLNYGLFLNPHQPSPLCRREGQALRSEFVSVKRNHG